MKQTIHDVIDNHPKIKPKIDTKLFSIHSLKAA